MTNLTASVAPRHWFFHLSALVGMSTAQVPSKQPPPSPPLPKYTVSPLASIDLTRVVQEPFGGGTAEAPGKGSTAPVTGSRLVTVFWLVPLTVLNWPPAYTLEPSSAMSTAYTSPLTEGAQGSRVPRSAVTAASRSRSMPLTRPNEPPKYTVSPSPETAIDLTRYETEGFQFDTSAPVAVSKAAIRLRVTPLTVVKSPPMKIREPSGDAATAYTWPSRTGLNEATSVTGGRVEGGQVGLADLVGAERRARRADAGEPPTGVGLAAGHGDALNARVGLPDRAVLR